MRTSHGRVFTDDGECYDGVDVPDDAYESERFFFLRLSWLEKRSMGAAVTAPWS